MFSVKIRKHDVRWSQVQCVRMIDSGVCVSLSRAWSGAAATSTSAWASGRPAWWSSASLSSANWANPSNTSVSITVHSEHPQWSSSPADHVFPLSTSHLHHHAEERRRTAVGLLLLLGHHHRRYLQLYTHTVNDNMFIILSFYPSFCSSAGSCTVRWENKHLYCIVSVFGLAI